MGRRRPALALALICAVSIGLRLPFLSVPLITDEGGYAYTAHWMARGYALYRDLWFDRPQGIFLVYGAQMALLGESTVAIRVGAALYNALTTVLVYLLGRSLAGLAAGLAAAAVFAVVSASPAIEGFTANGELYMNLPLVACLLLAVRRRMVLAGLALALAVAIKPTALPAAAPALALVLGRNRALSWRALAGALRPALLLALGVAAGIAPFVAHGLATDPAAYWYSVVGFRVAAHSAFAAGRSGLVDFLQTAPTVLAALLPAAVLSAVALAGGGWRTAAGAFGLAFAAGSAAGAAAGGSWFWHYYVGMAPALALLAGLGAVRCIGAAQGAGDARWLGARWLRVALALSVAVAVAFNARLVGPTPQQTSWNVYRRPAYLASRDIAAYVRERTTDADTIYAAFAQADLYHLAGRRSAGRHLYWTEINRVPGALEAVERALDDRERQPVYVIRIDRELEIPGRAAPFWDRVARHYVAEQTIDGFTIFRLRTDPWTR